MNNLGRWITNFLVHRTLGGRRSEVAVSNYTLPVDGTFYAVCVCVCVCVFMSCCEAPKRFCELLSPRATSHQPTQRGCFYVKTLLSIQLGLLVSCISNSPITLNNWGGDIEKNLEIRKLSLLHDLLKVVHSFVLGLWQMNKGNSDWLWSTFVITPVLQREKWHLWHFTQRDQSCGKHVVNCQLKWHPKICSVVKRFVEKEVGKCRWYYTFCGVKLFAA